MSDAKSKIAKALMKDPEWEYGSILPIATRGPRKSEGETYGDVSLALPDIIRDPLASWVKIRDSNFTDYDTQDVLNIMPMPAAAGAAGVPKAALGMFGGRLAATADKTMLKQAEEMAAAGMPREDIWKATGWFQGVDGKWRFEIDDSSLKVRKGEGVGIGDDSTISHHDLSTAYPDMSVLTDVRGAFPFQSTQGSFLPGHDGLSDFIRITAATPSGRRRAAAHELQHAVQKQENFAFGGSPKTSNDYEKIAGEVEARAVERRLGLSSDQRRARPPWQDYDVPEHEQIVSALLGGKQ